MYNQKISFVDDFVMTICLYVVSLGGLIGSAEPVLFRALAYICTEIICLYVQVEVITQPNVFHSCQAREPKQLIYIYRFVIMSIL